VSLLTTAAGKTLGPYWNAILGDVPKAQVERAEVTFRAETLRQSQIDQRAVIASTAFAASPDVNSCPHVHELERVYSVRGDEQRMRLFEKCFAKYQAGQRGNYILCGTCGKDFVCKHEVLLLNEFLHPGRGTALHKHLLLDFAGPVFEGAYICKSCGQKIRDIEYDTHLEFDDEGRPLVGRNVVETEDTDETDLALVLHDEVVEALPFPKETLPVYYTARTISEQCGLTFPMDTYRRIVDGWESFLEKLPQREPYEKKRKEVEDGVKAGKQKKGTPIPPPYENFLATYQIIGLAAFVILEIQTSTVTPPVTVAGCVFLRDGFPLDTAGTGTLTYVACTVANILRNDAPWNKTSWSAETNMAKRIAAISDVVRLAFQRILALSPGTAPLRVTDMYRTRLEDERERRRTGGVERQVRASDADRLPPCFRPLQRIVPPAATEEKPVANISRFLGAVSTAPIADIRSFVDTRSEQLSLHILDESHAASQTTATDQAPKRSDATCCPTKLADVSVRGMGVLAMSTNEAWTKEYELHASATTSLARRDPAACFAGTHLYVPWSAPVATSVVPGADPAMYYKIFIKHCYRGDRYGYPHEITVNSTCRRCGFPYPSELDTLDTSDPASADKRRQVSLAALAGVEINDESFTRLDRQSKQLKAIPPEAVRVPTSFLTELVTLGGLLTDCLTTEDWTSLVATMTDIQGGELRDIARRVRFADVSRRYDAVRAQFAECFSSADVGAAVVGGIDALTESTAGSTAVRNLQQVFCVQGTQIARKFVNDKARGRKWFNTIHSSHQTLLDKIWAASAANVKTSIQAMDESYGEISVEKIQPTLTAFTQTFSSVYEIWIREIRSNIHFTDDEYRLVLRWITMAGLRTLLSQHSVYYHDMLPEEKKKTSEFLIQWVQTSVTNYVRYIDRYQRSVAEINEAINARAELEKAFFIKRFDDLDRDLRAVEKIKKTLKIGDWAVGTVKNLFTYDADFYEFERSQRAAMGLPDMAGEEHGAQQRNEVIDGGYDNRPAADEDY